MNKLKKTYGVFGDFGGAGEELLFETDSAAEAIEWADRYTDRGDFGGYNVIEVGFFTRRGEYETTWKTIAPEERLIDELY